MTQVEELMSPDAVRRRCGLIYRAAQRGETRHFRLVPGRLAAAASYVAAVTRERYPDLKVPGHSRWPHINTGGVNRQRLIEQTTNDAAETARSMIDLAVVSVLLDAGAGPDWSYWEEETGQSFSRSEGLAVASLRAMQSGLFSSGRNPWRADADALRMLTSTR